MQEKFRKSAFIIGGFLNSISSGFLYKFQVSGSKSSHCDLRRGLKSSTERNFRKSQMIFWMIFPTKRHTSRNSQRSKIQGTDTTVSSRDFSTLGLFILLFRNAGLQSKTLAWRILYQGFRKVN